MKQGCFISFEGGEGAGKTSLIDLVEEHLRARGLPLIRIREPGGTHLGEQVRALLLDPEKQVAPRAELALFMASRAQILHELILPSLRQGKIVLCDRFNESTIAYQGAARGLGTEEVARICSFFCDHVEPQLTLYLDLDPVEGLARAAKTRKKDRIEQEDLAFHRKIREAYCGLAAQHPARIHLIDASQPIAGVLEDALQAIHERFPLYV